MSGVVVVTHPGGGNAGVFGEHRTWNAAGGEQFPGDASAVVVLGGGQNVHETDAHPWLQGELTVLETLLEREVPLLGVCLGAQLVCAAAGGSVQRTSAPEIGWTEVRLRPEARDDPLLAWAPETFTAYQWHSYAATPPEGSVSLAENDECVQAFRIGRRAWGVQFHPEVTAAVLEEWAADFRSDADAVRLGFDPDAARADWEPRLPQWNAFGRRLFGAWRAACD